MTLGSQDLPKQTDTLQLQFKRPSLNPKLDKDRRRVKCLFTIEQRQLDRPTGLSCETL